MDRVLVVQAGRVVFDGGPSAAVEHYRAASAAELAPADADRPYRERR
jgi:biotin transport system ATP-binding protein